MNQPVWKVLAHLGDRDPLNGGHTVFTDTTGVYSPEAEICDPLSDDNRPECQIYRYSLDRCRQIETSTGPALIPAAYRPEWPYPIHKYVEWFSDSLDRVAESNGIDPDILRASLCSEDAIERAQGYEAIGRYHGFENLDNYPLMLTAYDVELRYHLMTGQF